jgi:peroxiredoxin
MRGCNPPPIVRPLLGVLLTAGLMFVLTASTAQSKKPDSHGLPQGVQDLKIGDAAPDFSLPGIDGKKHTLGEYRDASVLMIAFISNHCPDSHAALGRIEKLADELKDKSFQLVAINPNNPEGLSIDELGYSKYNDSLEDMKKYAAEAGITFPYLYDGDTQSVAKAYGCLATPHVFVFDAQRKLRYKGEFDNSRYPDPATVTAHEAQDAVDALLDYKPVPVEVTKPHGCSTKWIEKKTEDHAGHREMGQSAGGCGAYRYGGRGSAPQE